VARWPWLGRVIEPLLTTVPALTDPLPVFMKVAGNMSAVANDQALVRAIMADPRAGGNWMSARFLRTLLGTPDDWQMLRRRAAVLMEFGLDQWARVLLPVLDEIVHTAEGKVDRDFWRSFFRYESASGSSLLTGWILTLFPYLCRQRCKLDRSGPTPSIIVNQYFADWEKAATAAEKRIARNQFLGWDERGPTIRDLPAGIASAAVVVRDIRYGSEYAMRFAAGLFGVGQQADGGLVPEFGWAILYDD
jgi:hypothetical protein